jgi:hypothetical protein
MQIKNVINDNDYEFTLPSIAATFATITSLSSTSSPSTSSHMLASSSATSLSKENQHHTHPHHHQQDVLKICVLLFDTYLKLCTTTANESSKIVYISRQSIQESLLPGLICLKEIFENNVIASSTATSSSITNDYAIQLELIINKVEQMFQQSSSSSSHTEAQSYTPTLSNANTTNNNNNSYNLNSNHSTPSIVATSNEVMTPNFKTPTTNAASSITSSINSQLSNTAAILTNQAANTVGDLVNACGVAVLSTTTNLATPNALSSSTAHTEQNANFKSFVFKGINNLKDQSKDKFTNFLLTNKSFKK